jgi:plasmid maintenance system killer protein
LARRVLVAQALLPLSLTITGNWRLVFRYDPQTNTATDIDLIDYH